MKCNYCGRTEVCQGSYPEGCFLEHQIAKIDYKSLLREFMVRTQYVPPISEEEENWWNEGTNAMKHPELLEKFVGAVS